MRPKLLPSPAVEPPQLIDAIKRATLNEAGEIDNVDIENWDASLFYEHLQEYGYQRRSCVRYASLDLTCIDGSCRWHNDPGFGLVACWLVYNANPIGSAPQLVTRYGPLDMLEGELCVFDADQGHVWISNEICVMVMATVSKARRATNDRTRNPAANPAELRSRAGAAVA